MSSRVVTAALAASALGVGVLVGLAAPRGIQDDATASSSDPQVARLTADLTSKDEWISALGDAAISGRIEGMRVVLLVTDGTPSATVDEVSAALERGGATVESTALLGAEWWDPTKSSFRGELADQVSASVAGVDGLGTTDVLEHAIVQAIVPGALPRGGDEPEKGTDPAETGTVDSQAVLLEVLTRAEILTVDHPAVEGADAVVVISGAGPEGAGETLNAAASAWERYLGSTLVVVAGDASASGGDASGTVTEAVAAGVQQPQSARPSVVVINDTNLAAAQVVMALTEQASGGTGVYGNVGEFDLIAVP